VFRFLLTQEHCLAIVSLFDKFTIEQRRCRHPSEAWFVRAVHREARLPSSSALTLSMDELPEHPKYGASFLELLPMELKLRIVEDLLEHRDVLALSLVSKHLNDVANKRIYRTFAYCSQGTSIDKTMGNFIRALRNRPTVRQYVREVRLDERSYIPWQGRCDCDPCFDKLLEIYSSNQDLHEMSVDIQRMEAFLLRAYGILLLVSCPELEILHLALASTWDPNSVHPLGALLKAATPDSNFHAWPKLRELSLDFNVRFSLKMRELLRILSIPSLRAVTLTSYDAHWCDYVVDSLDDIKQRSDQTYVPPSSPLVQQLQLQGYWRNFLEMRGTCTARAGLLKNLPKLRVLHIHMEPNGDPLSYNPTEEVMRLNTQAFMTTLKTASSTLQHLSICTSVDLFKSWFLSLEDDTPQLEGFAAFNNLRILEIPEWLVTGAADIAPVIRRLTRVLPSNLQVLRLFTAVDVSRIVIQDHTVLPMENEIWQNVRDAVENRDQRTSHRGAIYSESDRTLPVRLRMSNRELDTKRYWQDVWKGAVKSKHFRDLERVELLHLGTEAHKRHVFNGRRETILRLGAEVPIVVWERGMS
jgi:hypothetical protein